jgi:hypothetical protein
VDAPNAKPIARLDLARDVLTPITEGDMLPTFEHLDVYSSTLPASGMWADGLVSELPMPGRLTDGSGSSLLRTPMAAEDGGGPLHPDTARERGQTLRLTGQMLALTGHLLPTPRTTDKNGPGVHGTGGLDLRTAIHLLPTPAASNPNDGEPTESWLARRSRVKMTAQNGNGMGMPLTIAAQLIGESTPRQSSDGNTSSDGWPLPPPLLTDEVGSTDSLLDSWNG